MQYISLDRNIKVMKSWLKRQEDRDVHPNADAIWAKIKINWPEMSEEDQNKIFAHL